MAGSLQRDDRIVEIEVDNPSQGHLTEMTHQRSRLPGWAALLFVGVGFVLALAWTNWAETEIRRRHKSAYSYDSIVALVNGSAPAPFVYRRLYPDAIELIVWAVPREAWDQIRDLIVATPAIRSVVVDRFKWNRPEQYPVLLSGTFLIWLSAAGFMFVAYRVIMSQYDVDPVTAVWLTVMLGIGLLGAGGDRHYVWYPYDFTNAFVFSACLLAIVRRSLWFVPTFMAAAYSKETAVLLIVAYLLVQDRVRLRNAMLALGLGLAYVVVQVANHRRFAGAAGPEFWWPYRNLRWVGWELFFDSWLWPFVAVGIGQMIAMRRQWPRDLRRLSLIVPLLVLPAFFKGWIEERRQYLEFLVVAGPIVLQWLDGLLGTRLLTVKHVADGEAGAAHSDPARRLMSP